MLKKIITLFDVLNAPWHVVSFAITIARENNLPVTGVFIRAGTRQGLKYPFPNDMGFTTSRGESLSGENEQLTNDNIQMFKDECETAGITFEIRKETSIDDLLTGQQEGDLVIADTRADFLDGLLPKLTCPVCLTSQNDLPGKVILLLDENPASRIAIEKFASIFPHLTRLPATVISINLTPEQRSANNIYVEQKLEQLFSSLKITALQGDVEKELVNFLNEDQKHVIIIMGAFGRSRVSRFFHQSLANVVLQDTKYSLFIVHR